MDENSPAPTVMRSPSPMKHVVSPTYLERSHQEMRSPLSTLSNNEEFAFSEQQTPSAVPSTPTEERSPLSTLSNNEEFAFSEQQTPSAVPSTPTEELPETPPAPQVPSENAGDEFTFPEQKTPVAAHPPPTVSEHIEDAFVVSSDYSQLRTPIAVPATPFAPVTPKDNGAPTSGEVVEGLVLWTDVGKSSLVLGLGLLLLFNAGRFMQFFSNSLLSISCNVMLVHLAWRYLQSTYNSKGRSDYKGFQISEEDAQRMSLVLARRFNSIARVHSQLFAGSNVRLTVKLASALFVFAKVGAFLTTWIILTLGLIGAFTLPAAYVKNRELVDTRVRNLKGEVMRRWRSLNVGQQRLATLVMGVALLSLSDAPTKFFLVFMALTGLHLYRQRQPDQVDLALRLMKDGAERARKRLSLGAKGVAKNFSPMKSFEKKIFSPMMTKMFTPTKHE